MVLDRYYGLKWPDTVFQVPDLYPIYLTPIHKPERTQCSHAFHKRYLLQHLSNLQSLIDRPINSILRSRKMGEWLLKKSIALSGPEIVLPFI
ncbi:hypothetical protein TNCV_3846341 [Trichonephila clavipes]|nr:hypothetical protein TNCV_3846341 [Trichonephila clavipes]